MRHARAAVLAFLAVPVAGCGAGSPPPGPANAGGAKPAAAAVASSARHGSIAIRAQEFSFAPHAVVATAGKLRIVLRNKGHMTHELILLRTNRAPGSLHTKHGRVSEAASVGEISETEPGRLAAHTFKLKPGRYLLVCNVKGHYAAGMRGRLTVK